MRQARVLADRVISREGVLWDVARMAAANLLLILCAWIALPLPWTPVPLTGQTFGVLLVAVLLGARRAALVLGFYVLEGIAGLPVFQPFGLPGAARLAGPTAGYLLAYPAAAFVTGWLVERSHRASALQLVGALLSGEIVIFAGGCAWLATAFKMGLGGAIVVGLQPFLLGELIKMALVLVAVRGVELGINLPRGPRRGSSRPPAQG
ncbi:MAG TPA: biotin transporter BioY [Candidatus Acidoferrales bacterium]|nr:biotin transporter BioY [Candidatus Acidoferrales bacterium]